MEFPIENFALEYKNQFPQMKTKRKYKVEKCQRERIEYKKIWARIDNVERITPIP